MIDIRVSNPGNRATSLDLRSLRGAAGSLLVASDGVGVDVRDGAVGLEVGRHADGGPVGGAR